MTKNIPAKITLPSILFPLLLLFLVAVPFNLPAQSLFDQAIKPATKPALDFNGYIRSDIFLGQKGDATEFQSAYAEIMLKAMPKLGYIAQGYGEVRLKGIPAAENGKDWEAELREAYISLDWDTVDLRLGYQIFAWGRADGFNPTDNLTPQDMAVRSAQEDDRRLSNLALRLSFNPEPFRIIFAWLPLYRPSRLPDYQFPGRMAVKTPFGTTINVNLNRLNAYYPQRRLEDSTFALKVNAELAAIDFSVSYLNGFAGFAGFELLHLVQAGPFLDISVRQHPFRQQVAGCDFSTTLWEAGLRGEAAFFWPQDYREKIYAPNPYAIYVLGVDKEFFSQLSLILQYIGKWTHNGGTGKNIKSKTPLVDSAMPQLITINRMIFSQQYKWQSSISTRLAWTTLYDTLTLEIFGLYNVSSQEYMLRPRLKYKVADGVDFIAGADILGGPKSTMMGKADQLMTAALAELKYSF